VLTALLLAIVAAVAAGEQAPSFDSSKASVSAPKVLAEIDAGKLKGDLSRLAWSDDGQFFLRSVERDIFQNELGKNYVLTPAGAMQQVTEEPAWSALYWSWKAGLSAPGSPDVKLDIERREQNRTATGSTGQDFGSGGTPNPNRSDPSSNQISKDMASMQKVVTVTVRFKGETIYEVQNSTLSPGTSFSWAPAPKQALVFVNGKKRLVIVDRNGRKLDVPGTGDVLLPAWSPDGSKIAFLQKIAKKRYALTVVEVG
jgi:hypothetical protein